MGVNVDILTIVNSGLRASQNQLNVISQNVANASTPGYTRKKLPQFSATVVASGAGVSTGIVQRTVNTTIQNSLLQQVTQTSKYDVQEQYLNRLQTLQGTPDSEQSITAALNKLKNGFASLSVTPSDSLSQSQVVTYAQQYANQVNQLSTSIQSMRNDAQNNMADIVNQVNTQLTAIATLNAQITNVKASGQDATSLEDQRDLNIQNLSQNMNISTYKADNTIVVQTANGQVLADTVAYPISFNKVDLSATTTGNPITLNGANITSYITGGKLGGLLDLRDNSLPTAQARLDEMAEQTAVRFNEQGLKLFTDKSGNVPSSTAPTSAPPTGYLGFSGLIQVNTAVVSDPSLLQKGTTGATSNAGDVTLINNVLDYTFGANKDASNTPHASFNATSLGAAANLSSNLPTNTDLLTYSTQLISRQAQEYSDTKGSLTTSKSYSDALQTKLANDTGVNIDDEMANMLLFQRAYQASAQMISTVKTMFDQLAAAIGR